MKELIALGYLEAYHPPRGRPSAAAGRDGVNLYSSGEAPVARNARAAGPRIFMVRYRVFFVPGG